MNDARPYASLSSGLLARKGTAKPAMRPQNYGSLEDLGWNDMGHAPGEQPRPPAPGEHVPSSIAALTPAPRIQRTHPTDSHLPPEAEEYFGEEAEEIEGAEAIEGTTEDAPQAYAHPDFAPETGEAPAEVAEEPAAEDHAAEFADHAAGFEPEAQPASFEIDEPASAFEAEQPAAEPAIDAPSVVAQQRAILERFDALEEPAAPAAGDVRADIVPLPGRAAGDRRKAAFTLRLDAERHLRLRLACAVTRHSAQQIVARALDEALANIPEIEALASQVPAKPGRANRGKV